MKITKRSAIVPARDVLTERAIQEHKDKLEQITRKGLHEALAQSLKSEELAAIAVYTVIEYFTTHALTERGNHGE